MDASPGWCRLAARSVCRANANWRTARTRKGLSASPLWAWVAALSSRVAAAVGDLDTPPAEQARIDRPDAWAEQRKRSCEHREQGEEAGIAGVGPSVYRCADRREYANDRRSQAYEQEHARQSAWQMMRNRSRSSAADQWSDTVEQQRASGGNAHEQKPGARGAMGERRE